MAGVLMQKQAKSGAIFPIRNFEVNGGNKGFLSFIRALTKMVCLILLSSISKQKYFS